MMLRYSFALFFSGLICYSLAAGDEGVVDEFKPDQNSLPVSPPSDAIILFDGKTTLFRNMDGEPIDWPVEDGSLVSTKRGYRVNHIVSQWHFRDAEIHVEFMVDKKGSGNSGVYLHGNYELQIYNSFGKDNVGEHDEGALYGFSKPLVNAARPVGEWQVYDIRYRAPRRDAEGKITEEGVVTAWLNGEKVQDGTRFGEPRSVYHPFRYGTTPYLKMIAEQMAKSQTGPVFLQDHDSPTRFRNVWFRPLDDKAFLYEPPASP
jgi:hypothetical protein